MKPVIWVIGLSVVISSGCASTGGVDLAAYQKDDWYLQGVYAGVLPCADCGGIETELAVWSKGEYDYTACWYRLTETYQGKPEGESTFVQEGEWYLERGSGDDPDDTTYALHLEGDQWRRFVIDDAKANTLTLLGTGDKRPVSALNYSLGRRRAL